MTISNGSTSLNKSRTVTSKRVSTDTLPELLLILIFFGNQWKKANVNITIAIIIEMIRHGQYVVIDAK